LVPRRFGYGAWLRDGIGGLDVGRVELSQAARTGSFRIGHTITTTAELVTCPAPTARMSLAGPTRGVSGHHRAGTGGLRFVQTKAEH
jgi:hypothetical protein